MLSFVKRLYKNENLEINKPDLRLAHYIARKYI